MVDIFVPTSQNPSFCLFHNTEICLSGKSINSLWQGEHEISQTAFFFRLLIDWFPWETFWQDFSDKDSNYSTLSTVYYNEANKLKIN